MFCHRLRVLYGDTDMAGIVYHANYLRFFESARGALLREAGLPYSEIERRGLVWPVVESWLRHRGPARYDDELEVGCWVSQLGRASVTFSYRVTRVGEGGVQGTDVLCEGATRLGCTRRDGFQVVAIPEDVREVLRRHTAPAGQPGRTARRLGRGD